MFLKSSLAILVITGLLSLTATANVPIGESRAAQQNLGILNCSVKCGATIDGNTALDGMTVASGSVIKTADSQAKVIVSGIGEIDISPASSGTVEFNSGNLNAKMDEGSAEVIPYHPDSSTGEADGGAPLPSPPPPPARGGL